MTTPSPQPGRPPPGWHPDPAGQPLLWWWDGSAYTHSQLHFAGQAETASKPRSTPSRSGSPDVLPQQHQRRVGRGALGWLSLVLVSALVGWGLFSSPGGGQAVTAAPVTAEVPKAAVTSEPVAVGEVASSIELATETSGQADALRLEVVDMNRTAAACSEQSVEPPPFVACMLLLTGTHYVVVFENISTGPVTVDGNDVLLVDRTGRQYAGQRSMPDAPDARTLNPGQVHDYSYAFPGAPSLSDVTELWFNGRRTSAGGFVSATDSEYMRTMGIEGGSIEHYDGERAPAEGGFTPDYYRESDALTEQQGISGG